MLSLGTTSYGRRTRLAPDALDKVSDSFFRCIGVLHQNPALSCGLHLLRCGRIASHTPSPPPLVHPLLCLPLRQLALPGPARKSCKLSCPKMRGGRKASRRAGIIGYPRQRGGEEWEGRPLSFTSTMTSRAHTHRPRPTRASGCLCFHRRGHDKAVDG